MYCQGMGDVLHLQIGRSAWTLCSICCVKKDFQGLENSSSRLIVNNRPPIYFLFVKSNIKFSKSNELMIPISNYAHVVRSIPQI